MGALTPTNSIGSRGQSTEFAAGYKIQVLTVTPAAASDTVTLVLATDKIRTILYAHAHLTAGLDANLTLLQTSFSGLVITIKQLKADGATNASDWTDAAITLLVIGI